MTELQSDYFERPLAEVDPEVADAIQGELHRQQSTLEMIASENFVPQAILECQGSVLTNKYAEGLPGKRYYGGCEHVDVIETLAIERAKALFGAEHANVQPHAGAQANAAVYHALLDPGDTILGLALPHGGHLTHGMKINVSGKLYDIAPYEVDRETSMIDMDAVAEIARERRPKLILAGWSAYPRFLDFERFREIADEVGAFLMVDMAHFAGLVAAGIHPNPVPIADVVTTTVHKTLGGARGGAILCKEEYAKKINSAVFPGQQGGPLEHVIAGKAVAFKIAATEMFRERQRRTVAGAQAVASELLGAGHGVSVLTGGTDVHLVLVDLRESELDGQQAEDRLHEIGITVNRNAIPFDPRPPMVTSGLRVGTAALATRGLQADDFPVVGSLIARALQPGFDDVRDELAERVAGIAERYPLYANLGSAPPSSAGPRGPSGRSRSSACRSRPAGARGGGERLAGAADRRGQDEVPRHAERDLDAGEQQRGRQHRRAGGHELGQQRDVEQADLRIRERGHEAHAERAALRPGRAGVRRLVAPRAPDRGDAVGDQRDRADDLQRRVGGLGGHHQRRDAEHRRDRPDGEARRVARVARIACERPRAPPTGSPSPWRALAAPPGTRRRGGRRARRGASSWIVPRGERQLRLGGEAGEPTAQRFSAV